MDMAIKVHALGEQPGSVVAQVGLAIFDPRGGGVVQANSFLLEPLQQALNGFRVEEPALNWWKREVLPLVAGDPLFQPDQVSRVLRGLAESYGVERVWAFQSRLEFGLLETLFLGECPWGHGRSRCAKTLLEYHDLQSGEKFRLPFPHHALSAAMELALNVQTVLDE